jgi:ATP-binding cassette, subfamily B, bacterial
MSGMALIRGLRGSIGAVRGYLATVGPLARLIWQASPRLALGSAALAVIVGMLPAADIVIVSALLQTLVNVGRHAGGHSVGAVPHFLLFLGLLAGLSVVTQICERLAQLVNQLMGSRITHRMQWMVAGKAASADLAAFEDRAFHDEIRLITNEAMYQPLMIVQQTLGIVTTLATMASLGTILLLWHPWIVGVLLLASAATLWVSTHFATKKVDLITGRAEAERSRFYLYNLMTSDQAAKEVRLFGLRDLLIGRLSRLLDGIYREDRRLAARQVAYSLPAGLALAGTQIALIAFAAVEAVHGVISVGSFNQYMLAIIQFGGQLPMVAASVGTVHQGNLFVARLFRFLATEPRVEAPRGQRPADGERPAARLGAAACPHIVFDRVCFAYPGTDDAVLSDVSFGLRPGQTVALVGSNGSGKSTIVKLLAGLYEPTAGSVYLDGVDIRELDRGLLRARLSVIFQDFVVYHFSARENVGLGHVGFLDDGERIAAAARRSGLDNVIARLPDGYDTVLGKYWNKGHELSGGQRQLVALARALLRQAPVLVLDEPSSALDARTEAEFFRRLLDVPDTRSSQSQSVMFVSHRLSTARRADHILVLKKGRIVEQGSHDELMSLAGSYADMFRLQSAAYEDHHIAPTQAAAEGRIR